MFPEWNIQATIIKPGGFNTEWQSSRMKILSPYLAYATSPTTQFWSMLVIILFIGSSEKGAKAFVALVQKKDEFPLRIQLGTDLLAIVHHMATKTLADSEK